MIQLSFRGSLISVIAMALLYALDKGYLFLIGFSMESKTDTFMCQTGLFFELLNLKFSVSNLEYFADVLSIGAGVLGVLLGLFYTAFLTIVATKYSNINTMISIQLLEQKTINKYFTLLSSITALSFVFQFLLAFGYQPTLVSTSVYSLIVIFTIASFTNYGRTLHIYFDPSMLAVDILNNTHQLLAQAIAHKKTISRINQGKRYTHQIFNQIGKIQTIIEESTNPQISNTSLDTISYQVNRFADYFLSIKHKIPADKTWHPEIVKYKKWEQANEWDFDLIKSTGVDMLRENVPSYYEIEKKIIETQFLLFETHIQSSQKLPVVLEQTRFITQLSFQCQNEIFELYFDKLESFILSKLNTTDSIFGIQLAMLYPHLATHYLIGFNYSFENFDTEKLRKTAKEIHNFRNSDQHTIPYFLTLAGITYQHKLLNEKKIEGYVITREFYAEFELAHVLQYTLQTHLEFVIKQFTTRIPKITAELIKKNRLYGLVVSMDSIELQRKMTLFTKNLNSHFELFNQLNFQNADSPFSFKSFDNTIKLCESFNTALLDSIWKTGASSYNLKEKELPDIFGKFYQVIMNDLVDGLFKLPLDVNLLGYRIKVFSGVCLLYIQSLRQIQFDSTTIDRFALRLYPIITDLIEIQSLCFVIARAQQSEPLINYIYEFWSEQFESPSKELQFWNIIYPIYLYCKNPSFTLSSNSYIREHDRNIRLLDYLEKNGIFTQQTTTESRMFPVVKTISKIDDLYLSAIASSIHHGTINNVDLDEVFIEAFLRGRTALKEIDIKETQYGQRVRRQMEKKNS
ncbi:MAG: hypothetical protein HOP08_00685 [Cyclobacteriaceae bacterium]|nr:hypothetical protein [Cyclobacteriaceae bacterium]